MRMRNTMRYLVLPVAGVTALGVAVGAAVAERATLTGGLALNSSHLGDRQATLTYRITNPIPGDLLSCATTREHPATVAVVTPEGIAASPPVLTFTGCEVPQGVDLAWTSATAPGLYQVWAQVLDGSGGLTPSSVPFTLEVDAPAQLGGSAPTQLVDTTPPLVSYHLDPALPDGDNGWYRGDVTLTWQVVEAETPDSVVLAGCQNQHITADQPQTVYTCTATSSGGSTTQLAVSVRRDATPPTLTPTLVDSATPSTPGTQAPGAGTPGEPAPGQQPQPTPTQGAGTGSGQGTGQGSETGSGTGTSGTATSGSGTPGTGTSAVAAPGLALLGGAVAVDPGAADAGSGVASATCDPASAAEVGRHTVTCVARDQAGWETRTQFTYTVGYAPTGVCLGAPGHQILYPQGPGAPDVFEQGGTGVFQRGGVVALAFRACDAAGRSVGTPGTVAGITLAAVPAEGATPVPVTGAGAQSPVARWDANAHQWTFTLDTTALRTDVTYRSTVNLDDGSQIPLTFRLI